MPRVGIESTTPVFVLAKTVHALDRFPTVIGSNYSSLTELITPNTTRKIFSSQADFQISTELVAISSQSSSTAVSRDSLNYLSAGLGSSLYSLGEDARENIVSIVIALQYLDCCLFIRCRGNMFTESLHSNERPLWLRYSGFQASFTLLSLYLVTLYD
jgi:hypothetical protein